MGQSFKDKKVIVTGGAGFIGSHLVDRLIEEGADVYVIDNLSTGNKDNLNKKSKLIVSDFTDFEDLEGTFGAIWPNYVFHVGAWGRMPMCLEDPIGAYKNNVIGSLNLLEVSRKYKVKKVILSSSCIVYCEDTPYKSSKIAMEGLARVYSNSYGLSTICLRYGNVYGTRQNIDKDSAMFAMLRKSMNENGFVYIFGDGEQTRDWVHVNDICEANIKAALSKFDGEVDIATGRSLSLNYIVKEVLGLQYKHTSERKGDAKHINLSPTQAKVAIGFWHAVKFEDGIKGVWRSL